MRIYYLISVKANKLTCPARRLSSLIARISKGIRLRAFIAVARNSCNHLFLCLRRNSYDSAGLRIIPALLLNAECDPSLRDVVI